MAVGVPAETLRDFSRRLLVAAGVPEAAAGQCADVLVAADLEGNDSHGVMRLPIYLSAIARGQIDPAGAVAVEQTGPATAVVDGGNALGPVVGVAAMAAAIRLAHETGVGLVAARRSNHYGAAAYYAQQAAAQGFIGLTTTNTPPAIPPPGGREPYLGTNPIALAFPAAGEPVVVDLSLSVVARGKIIQAARQGQAIPPHWAVDGAGQATTDPRAALSGALLPLGGAKGFALALAVEILSGVLSGAACGPHVTSILENDLAPANVGHLFLAIDVGRFGSAEAFHAGLEKLAQELRALPLAEGAEAIRLPGERRARLRQRGLVEGVALADETVRALDDWAARLGVARLPVEQRA